MEGKEQQLDWDLFLIVWFPHSGCRWLNRSLLSKHSSISTGEYFLPWLTQSSDMMLNLDRTSQVHKSRSNKELEHEFQIVKESVDHGRREGILRYLQLKKLSMTNSYPNHKHGGVLSPGAPEPLPPDLDYLMKVAPKTKIIHLVRNPISCFLSMKSRGEMDGDPYKIGANWAYFNATIRNHFNGQASNYLQVRYEDVVENTAAELSSICSWIGVEYEEAMLADSQHYHGRNQNVDIAKLLTTTESSALSQMVQGEAGNYGYQIKE